MASEDIFEEYTEEIINEFDKENINTIGLAHAVVEETEDMIGPLDSIEENGQEIITSGTEQISEHFNDNNKETANSEQQSRTDSQPQEREAKIIQLPLARIRNIMKLDPDLNIASNEALFAVARSTELFIESLARESYIHTVQAKKKTVQKRDVEMAISSVDSLMFLEGAMNF